jgi:hypothetical protein
MHAAIREYKIQPGKVNELIERVRAEFFPIIAKAPGFVGYTLAQVDANSVMTVSSFETRQEAEESTNMAAGWIKGNLASLAEGPPRVTTGEWLVRHVDEKVRADYGIMRRFETDPADVDKSVQQVRDGLVPLLSAMPGFASYGLLLEAGRDRGVTLSAFADRATAEAANKESLGWVKEHLAGSKILEVITGDIKIRLQKAAVTAE